MKKKTIIKITLDTVMLIVLALMYKKSALGLAFHEIGGLAVIGAFVIHKLLNWDWIRSVTVKLFSKKVLMRTRVMYALDVCLLVLFLLIGISGVFISKIVFGMGGGQVFKTVHYCASAVAIALVGVHLGLHYSYLKGIIGRKIHLKRGAAAVLVVLMLAFGVWGMASGSYFRWLSMPFTSSVREGQPPEEMMPEMPDTQTVNGQAEAVDDAQREDTEMPAADRQSKNAGGARGGHRQEAISPLSAVLTFLQYAGIAFIWAAITVLIERAVKRGNLEPKMQ